MLKKYIVRLTDAERQTLTQIVAKFKGSSQKVRRAQILLKADADGPDWTDAKIAEAYDCRTKTVENIRNGLSRTDSSSHSTANRGRSRQRRSYSTANRKRKSSPCVWDRRRWDLPIGR